MIENLEGVLVSLLSNFESLDIDASGLVDGIFSVIEVLEFLDEVGDGEFQRGDILVELIDGIVNNSQSSVFVVELLLGGVDLIVESSLSVSEFRLELDILVLDVLLGLFNQIKNFIDLTTSG